jgi:aspartate aminotransferase-like enzyme
MPQVEAIGKEQRWSTSTVNASVAVGRALREVDAEGGERVIQTREGIAPDLGRYVVEFPFGTCPRERSSTCVSVS